MNIIYQYNTQPTFFIYDYETFGLNPALDRPVQFAGIRLDHKLNIIEKIKFFYCRIPNDYLPNPESVLITGLTPQFTIRHGLIESEFANRIYNIFNIPQTCIVGYNNIHFDDEFSRNIFYRNFYDPYSWSYQNGNSRWDILPILRAFYTLCPDQIQWPINNNNQISFRLTEITQINSIQHQQAHNATSDVFATLEIMKLLKTTHPELFQFLYNYRTKNQLKKIINFDKKHPLLHISNQMHDKHKNFVNFLIPIAWHPINRNILITYNLNNNIDNLLHFDTNIISQKLFQNQENIYSILNKLSLKLIRLNACPVLIPTFFLKKNMIFLNHTQTIFSNYQYCLKNLNLFQKNVINNNNFYSKLNKLFKIIDIYIHQKKINNQTHIDTQLYNRFFDNQDQKIIKKILNTDIEKLSTINFKETDNRLKSLLFYYRARNFIYTLNTKERKDWINYKKNILFKTEKYANYLKNINILLSYHKNIQKTKLLILLKEYYKYFHNIL